MKKILVYTVTDRKFFPGTLAAVNSFIENHGECGVGDDGQRDYSFDIVVVESGKFNEPLLDTQRELLERGVKVMKHSDFGRQGRTVGAWQLKAYGPHDLTEDSDYAMVIGFDSDMLFCSNVVDIIDKCFEDGKFRGGKDGDGANYDASFKPYGFDTPVRGAKYMSTSCYFCPLTDLNREILKDWATKTDKAKYGPQKEKVYPGHGDQGVLNACIYAATRASNVELLDNNQWSQHWVFEKDVVEWDGLRLYNYSARKPMRTLHCGGSDKFWHKTHSDVRRTSGGSQRWSYAYFLRMLALGPLSDWSTFDPGEVIIAAQHHLFTDVAYYHQLISTLMGPEKFRAHWSVVGWKWLDRTTKAHGQHRMMTLGDKGSMNQYIEIAKHVPNRSLIVEAGSYHGGSISTLALALLGRNHTIWSVESFTGNLNNTVDGHKLPQVTTYLQNLKHKWPFLNVNVMQLPGQLAAEHFEDGSIDFMFVDGDHSTEAVVRDINVWLPKVKPGGIIAGDDIGWKTVEAGVEQIFGKNYARKQCVWWTTV